MTTPSVPLLGFEGYIYVNGVELKECSNLRYGQAYGEVDATFQGDHGVKTYMKGQVDYTIGFDLKLMDTQSTEGAAVLAAIKSRTPIPIHAVKSSTGDGPSGTWMVFGQEVAADGENVQAVSCTCRPAAGYATPTWVTHSANNPPE